MYVPHHRVLTKSLIFFLEHENCKLGLKKNKSYSREDSTPAQCALNSLHHNANLAGQFNFDSSTRLRVFFPRRRFQFFLEAFRPDETLFSFLQI